MFANAKAAWAIPSARSPCSRVLRGGLAAARGGKIMEERHRCFARAAAAFLGLIALGACSETANTYPLNYSAQRRGPVKVEFVRSTIGGGPVTVTMADGEVLKGAYRVGFRTADGFGFAGRSSASPLVIPNGPVHFVAKGPRARCWDSAAAERFGR